MISDESAVVCPHCGERDEEWFDELRDNGNGSWYQLVECEICGEPFRLSYHMVFEVDTCVFDKRDEAEYAAQNAAEKPT